MMLSFHLGGAVLAPLAAFAAFGSRKGGHLHRNAGWVFGISMATVAFSGIVAAFCWWGALQGFGPALLIVFRGDDFSTTPYGGNQPGQFTADFFLFLMAASR
jgi:hypothetical protein